MDDDPFKDQKSAPAQNDQETLRPRVRLASEDDWATCRDLRIASITAPNAFMLGATPKTLDQELGKSEEEWRKETQSNEMFSVLSYVGSEAVGLGRAKEVEKSFWRIRNGWVKPAFERQGIQTKMIALRLREIIERGGVRVVTAVRPNNPVSLHNIEKFGFKIDRTEVDDTGNDWYILYLDLAPATAPEVIKKINDALNAG